MQADKKEMIRKYASVALMFAFALIAVTSFVTVASASDIFSLANPDTVAGQIADLYCKWSIPVMVVNAIIWASVKDDRKKEYAKRTLISLVIIYVVCLMYTSIGPTLKLIASWFGYKN